MHVGWAVAAALAAALCAAASSVLQHRGARQAPTGRGARVTLLLDLVRRPVWVVGLAVAAASLGFHLLALAAGALAVVQPLLVCGLLFALPISAFLDARRPSMREWLWALVLVAGLAVFLGAARPTAGSARPDSDVLAVVVGGGVLLAVASAAMGMRRARRFRPGLVGLAAGVAYGLVAGLLKCAVAVAAADPARLARSWPSYALLAIGAAALLLNQIAYQAGPLAASLPAMTIAEPVVAVMVGAAAFDEQLRSSPAALAAELLGLLGLAIAVTKLTRRMSPFSAMDEWPAGVAGRSVFTAPH